jgi:hypothetical protein
MEEETLHRFLFTTQWKRLVGMPACRWNRLISSKVRCDVADGIDLAQGAPKPRMNFHSLCNGEASVLVAVQEGSAVDWMIKESSINFWAGEKFFPIFRASRPSSLLFSLCSG